MRVLVVGSVNLVHVEPYLQHSVRAGWDVHWWVTAPGPVRVEGVTVWEWHRGKEYTSDAGKSEVYGIPTILRATCRKTAQKLARPPTARSRKLYRHWWPRCRSTMRAYWSYYDVLGNLASPYYHQAYIALLAGLEEKFPRHAAAFGDMRTRFEKQAASPLKRFRAMCGKVIEKSRNPPDVILEKVSLGRQEPPSGRLRGWGLCASAS
jgi:hypothetical protein